MRKSKLASICLYSSLVIILLNIFTVILLAAKKPTNLVLVISKIYKPIIVLSIIVLISSIVSIVRIAVSKKQLKGTVKSIISLILSIVMFLGGFAQGIFAEAVNSTNELENYDKFISTIDEQAEGGQEESGFDEWQKQNELFEEMFKKRMSTSTTPEGPNEILKGKWGSTADEIKKAEKNRVVEESNDNGTHCLTYAEQIDDVWLCGKFYNFNEAGELDSLFIEYNNNISYINNVQGNVENNVDEWSAEGTYKHYTDLKEKLQKIYGEPIYGLTGEIRFENDVPEEDKHNKSKWDELIVTGKMDLGCRFAAKDTSIKLWVMSLGASSDMFAQGQVHINCFIEKVK
ncbi:MAG: hypothetical protein ACFWTN_12805 [Clostridium sp.]|jgi:hypothetical protein